MKQIFGVRAAWRRPALRDPTAGLLRKAKIEGGDFKQNSAWSSKGTTASPGALPLRGNPKRRQAARTPKTLSIERHNPVKNHYAMVIYLYAIRIWFYRYPRRTENRRSGSIKSESIHITVVPGKLPSHICTGNCFSASHLADVGNRRDKIVKLRIFFRSILRNIVYYSTIIWTQTVYNCNFRSRFLHRLILIMTWIREKSMANRCNHFILMLTRISHNASLKLKGFCWVSGVPPRRDCLLLLNRIREQLFKFGFWSNSWCLKPRFILLLNRGRNSAD